MSKLLNLQSQWSDDFVDKLIFQHSLLQTIIDAVQAAIFIKDDKGKYLLINEAGALYFNKPKSEVIGKDDFDLFPREVAMKTRESDSQILISKQGSYVLNNTNGANGQITSFKSSKYAIENPFDKSKQAILGVAMDVTELKKVQDELEEKQKLLHQMFHLSPNIIFVFNTITQDYVYSNSYFEKVLGYSLAEITIEKNRMFNLAHPLEQDEILKTLQEIQSLKDEEVLEMKHRYKHKKGHYVWVHSFISPFSRDKTTGNIGEILVTMQDITETMELQKKLENQARYDQLTTLVNRRYFLEILNEKLRDRQSLTLLFIDLNKFKHINDLYGHDAGDAVLVETARRLNRVFRSKNDIVARLGGDEFTVIIQPDPNVEIENYRDRIQKAFRPVFLYQGINIQIEASVGHVVHNFPNTMTATELLKKADKDMYGVKNGQQHQQVLD
jgi:diguanylate cyclase (GGDEF)-like protein/PAS domain S-box-containing protein